MTLKNIFKRVKLRLLCALAKPFLKKPKVMSAEQTIDYMKDNRVSLGRFGDGELALMTGGRITFQDKNDELSSKLLKVKTTDRFLVAIPNVFTKEKLNKKLLTEKEYSFWKRNLKSSYYYWCKFFNKNEKIGNAFISRFYIRYNDKTKVPSYIDKLKTLWQDKDVVIVEGKNSQVGAGNDILNNAKSVKRILCPAKNAYSRHDDILESIKNNVDKNCLIILALGPTATVLAYELSEIGYWAIDMGHFDIEYEWFLAGAQTKIPVGTKHVNECGESGKFETENKEYLEQVIKIIE